MPSLDAANIAYNLLKMTVGEGIAIGSVCYKTVHILTPASMVRRIVNMSAVAVAGVKITKEEQ